MKWVLTFLIAFSISVFGQITITNGDVNSMFAVGSSNTIYSDTLVSSIDIGNPGGGNNWNFTNLQNHLEVSIESVDPSSTPHFSDFPTANICTYSMGFSQGIAAEIWSYSTINGTFSDLGYASESPILPGFVTTIKNDPARIDMEFPLTINSQWMNSYTQSIYSNGTLITSSSVTEDIIIDAYGSMTLPGGATFEALRMRQSTTISGNTNVNYTFLAKNGAQVSVSATNSNPPNSGVINVEGVSYNGAFVTSVEQITGLPEKYNLLQNYPNPFNPTTFIEYSVPEASDVELKVYDVLGNEITTLVNEFQSAGVYRADFNATDLASGMYIAQIKAGDFVKSIKMNLLK